MDALRAVSFSVGLFAQMRLIYLISITLLI